MCNVFENVWVIFVDFRKASAKPGKCSNDNRLSSSLVILASDMFLVVCTGVINLVFFGVSFLFSQSESSNLLNCDYY